MDSHSHGFTSNALSAVLIISLQTISLFTFYFYLFNFYILFNG